MLWRAIVHRMRHFRPAGRSGPPHSNVRRLDRQGRWRAQQAWQPLLHEQVKSEGGATFAKQPDGTWLWVIDRYNILE